MLDNFFTFNPNENNYVVRKQDRRKAILHFKSKTSSKETKMIIIFLYVGLKSKSSIILGMNVDKNPALFQYNGKSSFVLYDFLLPKSQDCPISKYENEVQILCFRLRAVCI